VGLVSLREGLDLTTPAGRLLAHVIASVAPYETEIRGERIRAGQLEARIHGKTWGGSRPGRRLRVSQEKEELILSMYQAGKPVAVVARTLEVSRPTVYAVLSRAVQKPAATAIRAANRPVDENRPPTIALDERGASHMTPGAFEKTLPPVDEC